MLATRREFLHCGAAGLSFVGLGGAAGGMLARAADAAAKARRTDGVLVVVELAGGNDGLNTLIPFEDAPYYKARPTLGIPKKDALKLSDRVGLHPRMGGMAELFKEGRLAIIQGVGYPEPDRSHFRSMEIWQTGSTAKRPATAGWLGRYLDATRPPQDDPAALRGLALTGQLPQAFRADSAVVPVVGQLDGLAGEAAEGGPGAMLRRLSTSGGPAAGPVAFLRRQAGAVYQAADRLKAATERSQPGADYPEGDLAAQLRRAAQILGGDVGVRVLFASQDGYDTHATQAEGHGALLEGLSQALAAFDKDLAARKLADRVLVLVFSEFGRRVDENASRGTDHGAASVGFLHGAGVRGGLAGAYPSLETLGEGDLIHTTDFRSVYATLLDRWLGCPAEAVLGQAFPPLDLVRAKA